MDYYVLWHVSDIHIRPGVHEDIIYAFEQLVENIKKENMDRQMVVMAGDIFESKNKFSQYDLDCFYKIINMLGNIKILIIPGNHDYSPNKNLDNNLDLVSAALKIKPNNVYVYSRSEIVQIPGIPDTDFHILSPMDQRIPRYPGQPEDAGFTEICKFNNKFKVAVLHEPIQGCKLYGSTAINQARLGVADLEKYNLVLAGDIHQPQILGTKKNIAYSGSLIQKTRAEGVKHGCIKWYFRPKERKYKHEFIWFKLNNAYIKIIVKNNIFNLIDDKYYKKVKHVEAIFNNCTHDKIDEIHKLLVEKYGRIDISDIRLSKSAVQAPALWNSHNNQLKLIEKELDDRNCSYKKEIIDLHLKLYNAIADDINNEKYKWCLDYLKWSNMFCYGENNYIDFHELNGIVSLIGKNKTGKSSIIDILIFILYDKLLRGNKDDMIRYGKDKYKVCCGFSVYKNPSNLEIVDKYVIQRHGDRKNNNCKVILLKYNGEKWVSEPYPGIRAVYDELKKIIGTVDDMISTNIILQDNQFTVNKKSTNQLNEFRKYFKLDQLEKIEEQVKKKINKSETIIKTLKKNLIVPPTDNLDEIIKNIEDYQNKLSELESSTKKYIEKSNEYNRLYHNENINISEIKNELLKFNQFNYTEENIREFTNLIKQNKDKIDELSKKRFKIGDEYLDKKKLNDEYQLYKHVIETNTSNIEDNEKKIKQLYNEIKNVPYSIEDLNDLPDYSLSDLIEQNDKKIRLLQAEKDNIFISGKYTATKSGLNRDEVMSISIQEDMDELRPKTIFPKSLDPTKTYEKPESITNLDQLNKYIKEKTDLENKLSVSDKNHLMVFNESCQCCVKNKNLLESVKEIRDRLNFINDELTKYKNYKIYHEYSQALKKYNILYDKEYYKELDLKQKIEKINKEINDLTADSKNLLLKSEILKVKDIIIHNEKCRSEIHILENDNIKIKNLKKKIEIKKTLLFNLDLHKNNDSLDNEINMLLSDNKKYIDIINSYNTKIKLDCNLEKGLQNIKYEKKLDLLKNALNKNENLSKEYNNKLTDLKLIKKQIEEYNTKNNEIIKLQRSINIYKIYSEIIGKDKGIPYKILMQISTNIQQSVNKTLKEITDFEISLDFGEKGNKFRINIIDGHKIIPAAQGSGFQKFIIELTLRLALTEGHPFLPNFIIIDEGFGCMDRDHLQNTKDYLTKLNNLDKFDWIIIISHIEDLQHVSEDHIEISQHNGLSRIKIGEVDEIITFDEQKPAFDESCIYESDGRLYCRLCKNKKNEDICIKSTRETHLTTASHQSKLKKKTDAILKENLE